MSDAIAGKGEDKRKWFLIPHEVFRRQMDFDFMNIQIAFDISS